MRQPSTAWLVTWRPTRLFVLSIFLVFVGCRTEASNSDSVSARPVAANTDTTPVVIVPCGRAEAVKCKGELPMNWETIEGPAWAVNIERWQHELGFGRPQMRRTHNSIPARYGAFTTIYPLDDAHTISPEKIGAPTVFAIIFPQGPDKEHKWGLEPSQSARYVAILEPSADKDKSTWRLERVYWDGNKWQHSSVPGTGKWRTCPEKHSPKDFAYADFLRCGQQPNLPPELLSFGLSTFSVKSSRVLSALPTAFNTMTRDGEEPIWIFCPAGCCEADWS
jgi:hypothetical protein